MMPRWAVFHYQLNRQFAVHWCFELLHNQVSDARSRLVHVILYVGSRNILLVDTCSAYVCAFEVKLPLINIYLSLWTKILPAGSYKHTVRGTTSVPNLFIAGDWIVNRHGSFSKVRGLQVRNWFIVTGNCIYGYFCVVGKSVCDWTWSR
jgi:hypothetical protein